MKTFYTPEPNCRTKRTNNEQRFPNPAELFTPRPENYQPHFSTQIPKPPKLPLAQ